MYWALFFLVETGDVCFCTCRLANVAMRKFKDKRLVCVGVKTGKYRKAVYIL
jgi:hypothetical protein